MARDLIIPMHTTIFYLPMFSIGALHNTFVIRDTVGARVLLGKILHRHVADHSVRAVCDAGGLYHGNSDDNPFNQPFSHVKVDGTPEFCRMPGAQGYCYKQSCIRFHYDGQDQSLIDMQARKHFGAVQCSCVRWRTITVGLMRRWVRYWRFCLQDLSKTHDVKPKEDSFSSGLHQSNVYVRR